jgi:hypothetical protein
LHIFSKTEKLRKILPFQCQKQLISQKVVLSFLIVFTFIAFYVGSGSNSGSGSGSGTETVLHSGSGSVKAKSYGSCGSGSGSTTLVEGTNSEFSLFVLFREWLQV